MIIIFVIDQLIGGGAAKKLSLIANELSLRGHQVTVATNTHKPIVYPFREEISIVTVYKKESYSKVRIGRMMNVMSSIRKLVNTIQPDVVVSVLPHVSFLTKLALIGKKIPVVFSDETSFARKDSFIEGFIRHHLYGFGDALVVLTENDCKLLGKKYSHKLAIHNPVEAPKHQYDSILNRKKRIVVVGQTNRWEIKGLDIAIDVWSQVAEKFADWTLSIVGSEEPTSKAYLEQLADSKKVRKQVEFLGFRQDIYGVLGDSQLFMLTSRFEGFSLSLIEALMTGVPCLSFSEHGVVDEVSLGGKGTVIVPDGDVIEMYNKLERLLSSSEERECLSQEGKTVTDAYNPLSIVNQWENLFDKLIRKKK